MCGCLILFQSLTHAQRAEKALERAGIITSIIRPPRELNENSCGYAVKISDDQFDRARAALRENELMKFKAYRCEGNHVYTLIAW